MYTPHTTRGCFNRLSALILAGVFTFTVTGSLQHSAMAMGRTGSDPTPRVTPQGSSPSPAFLPWTGNRDARWKEYDRLTEEQKYEKASSLVEAILEDARTAGDSEQWVRALIRSVQLRTALHGYEQSVRFLKEQPWPGDLLGTTVLHLFYARSLVTYANAYSWEIRQRERVETSGVVDLKAWTIEQIFQEAHRAYATVWEYRRQLGEHPVTLLKDYVELNNYPRNIRGSLRDTVTYLWAELLADTSGWRAQDANEVFNLSLPELLLQEDMALLPALETPGLHPLQGVALLLGDLQKWHLERSEPEAALEAYLTLVTTLHTSFTLPEDRTAIREALSRRLADLRSLKWWSMGMALLADFIRAEEAPDKLVRARETAWAGDRAHPGSMGGQRCRHIVASIEAPEYQLEAMASDGPQKRSLGVNYKNLSKLFFRAFPLDLKRLVETADDYTLFPSGKELEKILRNRSPSHRWECELPPTPDYNMHRAYIRPPMESPALYVVIASASEDFSREGNKIQAANLIIGNLVLVTRQTEDELSAQVLSGSTGKPEPGARVSLYLFDYRKGHRPVHQRIADDQGMAAFNLNRDDSKSYFLMAENDTEITLDPDRLYLRKASTPTETRSSLIYTDRSIYRPLQTVHIKVIAYRGRKTTGELTTSPDTPLTLSLLDANNQVVSEREVTTNRYGTASVAFEIPQGRLLGNWQIRSSFGGPRAGIRVEEYKRPTFEAHFLDPESPLRLNRPATVTGEARYYFGLPVSSGTVQWRVTRAPVYPWWWHYYGTPRGTGVTRPQTIAAGTCHLQEDGTFSLAFTPNADERLAEDPNGLTYRYALNAEVTDEGGETRSLSRQFRLGFVSVETTLQTDTQFFLQDRKPTFQLMRATLDGAAAPGAGTWRVVAIQGPAETLLPADQPLVEPTPGKYAAQQQAYFTLDDKRRPRWDPRYAPDQIMGTWSDGKQTASGEVQHGEDGRAEVVLPRPLPPGAYRLYYTTLDPYGAAFEMAREFIVGGRRTALPLPGFLRVEKTRVPVGETARILVLSGLGDQPMFLDLFRGRHRLERHNLLSTDSETLIEIPVTEALRGGFGVTLTLLRDHQLVTLEQPVFVPWDNKELTLSFSTFRDLLRPGEEETWTLKVTGPGGAADPVRTAEVLAYMYDRSLDAFAPHTPPNPSALFPSLTNTGAAGSSLGQAQILWVDSQGFNPIPGYPSLQGDRLAFLSDYGIGGPGVRGGPRLGFATSGIAQQFMPMRAKKIRTRSAPTASADLDARAPLKEEAAREQSQPPQAPGTPEADSRDELGQPGLRTDFSEVAFWQPHLTTDPDGSVHIAFTVPDAVTSWNVWAHAITRDLQSGSVTRRVRTVKDLMVRPYLPRFLREGDQAALKIVVNNASEEPLSGRLSLTIFDPETDRDLLGDFGLRADQARDLPFSVAPGAGTNLSIPISTPLHLGLVAFQVTAATAAFSDGERRALPILPGRMHLAQSRFVTLEDKSRREMHFDDMASQDDPSRIHEQLVVTVDAQLFYSVLSALPYLVNYPYKCTEQTLNRFLCTGILTSMYNDYPAIARMAARFSERQTHYETWNSRDPNRKMALEETPWLQPAGGGSETSDPLINVLDPAVAQATRADALTAMRKAQTSSGGFPWFPGGPPSPYMTLYILHGFSKALEFGVPVPSHMIQRAWRYLHRHYLDQVVNNMMGVDCCWEFVTFLNYTLSNYPDTSWTGGVFSERERTTMLDFSFRHWKRHAPYLKGYLALTLKRMNRAADAALVWESVMDSARTEQDKGTFWAPEDRSWLWYNDTIETHAFAIRTILELTPHEEKLDGLVLWLFLNKKLNHWKSTRATAEVVYSLAHYLKATAQLASREEIAVTVGDRSKRFLFLPDTYTGRKNQLVIPGEEIDGRTHASVVIEKETRGFALASATWHFSTEELPAEARSGILSVKRTYFKRRQSGPEVLLEAIDESTPLLPGDEVEVHLSLTAGHPMEYVHLRDPRPAGFEPVTTVSTHKHSLGISWYEEVRDSGTNFFFEALPQGEYPFKYRLRAAVAGTFKAAPATVQPMYAPEFTAYSSGRQITIQPEAQGATGN